MGFSGIRSLIGKIHFLIQILIYKYGNILMDTLFITTTYISMVILTVTLFITATYISM